MAKFGTLIMSHKENGTINLTSQKRKENEAINLRQKGVKQESKSTRFNQGPQETFQRTCV